ncbi:MAG: hypothetical protein ABI851_14385 [Saprospiraceae bacterium]
MRLTIIISLFICLNSSNAQDRIMSLTSGICSGKYSLGIFGSEYKEEKFLTKDYGSYYSKFGISAKVYKNFFLSCNFEFDHTKGGFVVTELMPNPSNVNLLSFSWNNVGLNFNIAPEYRIRTKFAHFYLNAGLSIREELINNSFDAVGYSGTGLIDFSGSKTYVKRKFNGVINAGMNILFNKIGINWELGYKGKQEINIRPDFITYKRNGINLSLGICYLF